MEQNEEMVVGGFLGFFFFQIKELAVKRRLAKKKRVKADVSMKV